ncbi:MAG TPA: hypothetical protein P5572_17530, partial [Phycisphaerae bacterium]|nr:hypothetical protein [Phycisphaerae bacterium]
MHSLPAADCLVAVGGGTGVRRGHRNCRLLRLADLRQSPHSAGRPRDGNGGQGKMGIDEAET